MKFSTEKSVLNVMAIIFITCLCTAMSFAEEAVKPAKEKAADKTPAKKAVADNSAKIGDKAASLDGLVYVKGEPVKFKEGNVYVVEFWATWCGPCKTSIPHLTKVQKEFKDKGVTVIGITNENKMDKIKNFVTDQGEKMDYTVAVDAARKISKGYMAAYKQRGIPTAFIVDKKGNIAWVGHPMANMDDILTQVVDGTFDVQAYAKTKAEQDAKKAADAAKMQKLQKLFNEYITAVRSGAEIEKTRPIAEKLIESDHLMALNALAMQIVSMKDIEDSKRDFETAIKAIKKANTKTEGKDARILNSYSLVLAESGKFNEAIEMAQKSVNLGNGKDLMSLNTSAMVLAKAGKLDEAVKTTEKAMKLCGDNKRAQDYFKKQLEDYKKQLEEKKTPPAKDNE